jgi:hypothetical protein
MSLDEIIKAVTDPNTKGLKMNLNIGFTDDSYWKIFAMCVGVCFVAWGLRYIIPIKNQT